ncbi:DUF2285 domain-containing protein [Agrobacterium sp. 22-209-1]
MEPALWTPDAFPRVLQLVLMTTKPRHSSETIPLSRLPGADCRPDGDDLYVLWKPKNHPHRLIVADGRRDGCFNAVLLPLDEAFETRLHAAGRFWRQVNGRPPGPDYGVFPPRSRQLSILTLRIFDARKAGASYREIANTLLSSTPIAPRDWRDHPLKHRIREFLLKADHMIYRGGYHDLLFYPHRRGKRRKKRAGRG